MDRRFNRREERTDEGYLGELWMVHGGGFYQVNKLKMGPVSVPSGEMLHWFKWEAGITWLSGFLLLILVFYASGVTFLVDPGSDTSLGGAVFVGLFALFGSWLAYDAIWESPLAHKAKWGHVATVLLACVVAYGLCQYFSGRAAYIHMGAVIGTWMAANVWMRIIPRQVKMVAAMEKGESVNPHWSGNAKNRSVHNNYFTLPLIFIMMSNHFPSTYGHKLNWVILILIGISGAAIRHYFNVRHQHASIGATWLPAAACFLVVFWMTAERNVDTEKPAVEAAELFVVNPETAATISGSVLYEGEPIKRGSISLPQECGSHARKIPAQSTIVVDGKVANALVYVSHGLEGKQFAMPSEVVEVDQEGCMYHPHVMGVRTHQEVAFLNSDDVLHNVRADAELNQSFNISMPNKDSRMTKSFGKAEVAVHVKCNLHPWMGAYIGVFDHPYFAVTDETGAFELTSLPPGTYELTVWHETLGTTQQTVTVSERDEVHTHFTMTHN